MKILKIALVIIINISCNKPNSIVEIQDIVVSYMECIECTNMELDNLVKRKEDARPFLTEILKVGPSNLKIDALKLKLIEDYTKLKEHEKKYPQDKVDVNEKEYLVIYVTRFINLYRFRAINALGKFGDSKSKDILIQAQQKGNKEKWRADIMVAIENAINEIEKKN